MTGVQTCALPIFSDFLFDDQSWTIRCLVVDVKRLKRLLERHDVVVAITAADPPDWVNRKFHLRLTKEQVRNSPDVDTEKPVSRQQEIAMREYFGRLAGWLDDAMFSPSQSMPAGTRYPVHEKGDAHLRSAWHLTGYQVVSTDGEIGRLEGFIMDESSWHIGYLDVKAGNWLQDRSVLVPTRWVKSVSWPDHRVTLHHP